MFGFHAQRSLAVLPVPIYPMLPTENPTVNDRNKFVRCVLTKEEHARKCKEEILILWTDFFKTEHLEMFPNLHDAFWKAAKLCSINKQEVSIENAQELVKAVDEIADIFNKAKSASNAAAAAPKK